jgi:uncharacterized membrane protein YcaP (DUF421 family)
MNIVEDILKSVFRTSISFFILMIVSLWVGKQVNSHTNYYNFALSITIGAFIANMGFDIELKFIPMLAAFLTLFTIYFLFSLISSSSRRLRMWLSGKPTVIIENGKILDTNMKKIRYTIDDLNQQLREQGVFDIFEVEYALLEVSGKISVLKKQQYRNLTKGDQNPHDRNQEINLPIELIIDGEAIEKNFNSKYTRSWLDHELKLRALQIIEIQYAVISTNGSFFIDLFDDSLKSPLDLE